MQVARDGYLRMPWWWRRLRFLPVFRWRFDVFSMQRRNMIGDGCGEPGNAGLSDFWQAAIRELNQQGIIPDCAHSGWRTSLEAAKVSSRPVVASHSSCVALYPHIRSKPDDVRWFSQ
ncbi:MAG: membrane dipeptidase [Planctomycetota bacterium]